MKLSTGITLFNKQTYKGYKILKNDILEKKCNFSVPIIDNTDNISIKTQKKKYLDKKEKEKLIKLFFNKNERNSRSKSNSNSMEYKQKYKSYNNNINDINQNTILNNNVSFNQNQLYNDKSKYIFSQYILTPLYGMKIYENVINKIFEYLKNIVNEKIYIDIKKMFIKYIYEELHIKTDLLLTKTDNDIMNVSLKLFYNKTTSVNNCSNSKNKKHKDFSFTRNCNNKGIKNHSYNTAKINVSKQYIFNGLLKNHNSLYSLNKGCAKNQGVPFSSNLSKSPQKTKSKSKSGSKEKKLINQNINKNYYSNNNIFDPDIHVFKILNQRKKNNNLKKNFSNINKNKIKKQLNSNFIFCKNYKNNDGLKGISNLIIYSEKNNENVNNNKSLKIPENNDKNTGKQFEDNKNNNKNNEQLKRIKSGLDENLKFLFNFSYENFLNKDSESESKKTVSDYNNIEINNKKNDLINDNINNSQIKYTSYQPKYI